MKNSINETLKRLSIAKEFNKKMKKTTVGIIIIGSVAYAPNHSVNPDSDLDLIVVYEDIKDCIDLYFKSDSEKQHLREAEYDGFLVKRKMNGVAVSIHNISAGALDKIAMTGYQSLVYYRQSAKNITYYSKDFDENNHPFKVKSVPVKGQMGVQRIDPIAFERDGHFVMGNDIDKLLSNAVILHDKHGRITDSIERLWENMAIRMIEHFQKKGVDLPVKQADLGKYLCRYDRFSRKVKKDLKHRTRKIVKELQKPNNPPFK